MPYLVELQTGGVTSLSRTTDDLSGNAGAIPGAVPKPASWAIMIFDLGAVRAALRRGNDRSARKIAFAGHLVVIG